MNRKKIKLLISLLTPRIIPYLYSRFISFNKNSLFDGNDILFKKLIKDIEIYGEYGCGLSSKWILKNTSSKIIAVDSSIEWVKKVKNDIKEFQNRFIINAIDLGDVSGAGRPLTYDNHSNFSEYTDFIWKQLDKPKMVLVDGRFRVCCFLTSLKFADPGTKIIFDDYVHRTHYHFVEKYVKRKQECGRQCLFIVPSKNEIDMDSLNKDIEAFRFVMD